MRHNKFRTWLATMPVAAMMVGLSGVLTGTTSVLAQRQNEGTATSIQRSRYADGVYTATGEYGGQPSHIIVTVTLRDGVIRDVKVQPQATVPRSLELQRAFAAAVPQVVVGKPIDQINVGKLAGSSGTPQGFNDAIRQIRQKARVG